MLNRNKLRLLILLKENIIILNEKRVKKYELRKFDTSIRRFSSISLKLLLVTIPNGELYFSSFPQGRNISMKFSWCKECGEFNSDDHYIDYCEQESLRRNGVAIMVNKSPKCSTSTESQKWKNDLYSFPRQMIHYHGDPSLCPN